MSTGVYIRFGSGIEPQVLCIAKCPHTFACIMSYGYGGIDAGLAAARDGTPQHSSSPSLILRDIPSVVNFKFHQAGVAQSRFFHESDGTRPGPKMESVEGGS